MDETAVARAASGIVDGGEARAADVRARGAAASEASEGDALQAYMRRMGGAALLTRDGELALAQRVEEGQRMILRALLTASQSLEEIFEPVPGDAERTAALARVMARVAAFRGGGRARGGAARADALALELVLLRPSKPALDAVIAALGARVRELAAAEAEIARCERRARVGLTALRATLRDARRSKARAAAVERRTGLRLGELTELERIASHERRRVASLERAGCGSAAQQRRVLDAVRAGQQVADDAKAKLVHANLRLVVSIARRYANRGMPLIDLIQDGNIGLMKGIDKFDHRRGFKLSTYATWWIRQSISRGIAERSRTVRLPVHVHQQLARVASATRQHAREHGREPTVEELAVRVGARAEDVASWQRVARPLASLDTPDSEGGVTLGELVEDGGAVSPAEAALASSLQGETARVLTTLTAREQKVLRLRFGIGERSELTLADIGARMGVTRERVRQIEAKALAKLRRASTAARLKPFVEPA